MPQDTLSTLFELLPIGAYRTTPAGVQLRANAALVRLNGYASEAEMLAATRALDEGWYVLPGRRQEFKDMMARQGHVVDFVSEVYRHKTRERIWVRETAHTIRDSEGAVRYYEGTVEDITASVQARQHLADSEALWRMALEAAGDGVWDWYPQSGREFLSANLLSMFGFEPGELPDIATELDRRTHPDDVAQMMRDRQAHFEGLTSTYMNEHRVQCKDGQWKWILTRGMVVSLDAAGMPLRVIGTHTDISQRKQAEEVIWRQANFDALTGLPNRRLLRHRLEYELHRCDPLKRQLAVMFIDLDRFKEVNDTLGHDCGDMLLVQAAHRIQGCIGPTDTVARMGGDEFTVMLADAVPDADLSLTLRHRVQAMLAALSRPFAVGAGDVFVSASIGVALFPAHGTTPEALFKHADQALYAAKGAGRNCYRFFTPAMQEAAQTRLRLDTDLRCALERQELQVYYQPVVEMISGRVRKAEALLRWHHPIHGLVGPSEFIPVAEISGLIVDIGDWVFRQAAACVRHWRQVFDPEFQVGVNTSPVQFHLKAGLKGSCIDMLAELGLPGEAVSIEITEGLLLDTSPAVTQHLTSLRASGIHLALDDFGTGYSSLSYLQKLDIDFIKIDQSFVRNLQPDSRDLALCHAIIAMAHALGMRVVGEGVETEDQYKLLMQAGCDDAQGYWCARPMPAAEFDDWMRARAQATQ
jgi:diguanylate cyclase (GGDEF)-like protein/PAS domain S-box-containing protein